MKNIFTNHLSIKRIHKRRPTKVTLEYNSYSGRDIYVDYSYTAPFLIKRTNDVL